MGRAPSTSSCVALWMSAASPSFWPCNGCVRCVRASKQARLHCDHFWSFSLTWSTSNSPFAPGFVMYHLPLRLKTGLQTPIPVLPSFPLLPLSSAVCQVLRMLSFSFTQLPGPSYHCRAGEPTAVRDWPLHWSEHLIVDVKRATTKSCGDLIFSSHTIFMLTGEG